MCKIMYFCCVDAVLSGVARLDQTVQIRISKALSSRIEAASSCLFATPSINKTAEIMIEQMLNLIEAPEASRRVPPIVGMIDAGRRIKEFQAQFAPANKLEPLAQAAIDQAVSEVKSGRQSPAELQPRTVSPSPRGAKRQE